MTSKAPSSIGGGIGQVTLSPGALDPSLCRMTVVFVRKVHTCISMPFYVNHMHRNFCCLLPDTFDIVQAMNAGGIVFRDLTTEWMGMHLSWLSWT